MPESITYNCDCLAYMRTLPDKAFDLAVVDPPYGAGFTEGGGCKGWFSKYHHNPDGSQNPEIGAHYVGRGRQKRYAETYDECSQNVYVEKERERENEPRYNRFGNTGSRFERYKRDQDGRDAGDEERKKIIAWDVAPGKEYFDELFRVSRNQIIWGGNYFELPPTRCFLIWRKLTISENFTMAMAEYAWTSFNENAKVFECAPQGRPGDERFHPCLPGETLVKFSGKWKPISEIEVGEENEFGRVSAVSTHDAEDMVEISADGETVTATWNHPFLVLRRNEIAWVNAENVQEGDELLCLRSTSLRKTAILDTEQTRRGEQEWSTTLFGKLKTALYRTVCKFTTRISIRRTMSFPISCLSRPLNTSGYTAVACVTKTENGSNRVKPAESTNRVRRSIGTLLAGGLQGECANHVLSNKLCKTGVFALRTVGSVNRLKRKTKVYNLTIDGIPAFETKIGVTHNTQKPIALYKWILSRYAKPGDRILDTHLGSGSSRIAAWDLGFDFVGCEIDKTYFELEEKRFGEYTKQIRFDLT